MYPPNVLSLWADWNILAFDIQLEVERELIVKWLDMIVSLE